MPHPIWAPARLSALRLGLMSHLIHPGIPAHQAPWWAKTWAATIGSLVYAPMYLTPAALVVTTPDGGMICGTLVRSSVETRARAAYLFTTATTGLLILTAATAALAHATATTSLTYAIPLTLLLLFMPEFAPMAWESIRAIPDDLAGTQALRATGWAGPILTISGVASTGGGLLPHWLTAAATRATQQGAALRLVARNQPVAHLYARHGLSYANGNSRAMIQGTK